MTTSATIAAPLTDQALACRAHVAEAIRAAHDARRPLYPAGGRTTFDHLTPPAAEALDLTSLTRIVDYMPRDMTIVVEAGVRMDQLAQVLAAEGQQLPIDVPRAAAATLGGVVSTNWAGPRRFGYGTLRDYVIGIHAIDGRGVAFKAGGRVVKNVAGYDFCKLLTGAHGTLGVVTQLALKLKPLTEATATVVAHCGTLAIAETILARLVNLTAMPVALDLLHGAAWHDEALPPADRATAVLVARLEGTATEVAWLADHVQYEFWQGGAIAAQQLSATDAERLWSQQVEFADRGPRQTADNSPLVVKIVVPPSQVVATVDELTACDPTCVIQAHAASGIVIARFGKFTSADVSPLLVGLLRPAALHRGGSLVVLSSTLEGLTPHLVWGGRTDATLLMERIKQQFDPHQILNPNRFIF